MTRLRHSGNAGQQPAGKNPFPLIRALQERRYRQTVRDIARTEELLGGISGKRAVYAELVRSSHASVVDEDEGNWGRAMAETKTYHSCRNELKGESAGAAFQLFSSTMLKVALFGGASLCMLHAVIPGMNSLISAAIGSLFALGAAMKTYALVSTGSQEFLDAVHANITEQAHSLERERRRLIKKLHGWKPSKD